MRFYGSSTVSVQQRKYHHLSIAILVSPCKYADVSMTRATAEMQHCVFYEAPHVKELLYPTNFILSTKSESATR